VTDERLTDELASRVLGWRLAPGRYIKANRGWTPRSKFRPLLDLRDAFRLLEAASDDYRLFALPGHLFSAHVRLAGRTGSASGHKTARTVTIALARALGVHVSDEETEPVKMSQRRKAGEKD
jgi:hypothetical protein